MSKHDLEFINPTLKQVHSPSQSQSISPFRIDQKLESLIQEIEQQNLCIKIKSQQIQELQSRNSELELHYQMKFQELEAKQLYQIELAQSQLREKLQENTNLLHELNQLKNQVNKYQLLLDQTNAENKLLRENESNSLKSQLQKQNDVIASLEEQNKYYEEEYNQLVNKNQNLLNQLKTSDTQIKDYQKELDNLTTQINQSKENKNNDIERLKLIHKQQIDKEISDNSKLTLALQQKQQEILNLSSQLQFKSQELLSINQQYTQQLGELELNNKNLQILVDHQSVQIQQLRKTISLLEKNLQNAADTETSYQVLLQTYNNLQEQLKQQSEIMQTANQQQQLVFSQQQQQQQQFQQDKIQKLTVMLKNRLDEIELWKNKCYQMETQDKKIAQENEILRQKYSFNQFRCNVFEINIKENAYASQEIQQLNQIILQQQEYIKQFEKQRKQLSSPRNSRYPPNEASVKEFNQKNKFH